MKRTVIIGTGGFAKSLYASLKWAQRKSIVGFIDDFKRGSFEGHMILGTLDDLEELITKKKIKYFIIAIGDPKLRVKISLICTSLGLKPRTIIDSSANVSPKSTIGKGAYIGKNTIINTGANIGKQVIINSGTIIEHGTKVGDYTNISPHCILAGSVEIGQRSYIGASTTIFQLITVGESCLIGAGSIVNINIPPKIKAFGVPVRIKGEI